MILNHKPKMRINTIITCIGLVALLLQNSVQGLKFDHVHFTSSNIGDIIFVEEGDWYTGKQQPTFTEDAIWLTPDPNANSAITQYDVGMLGRIVYKDTFTLAKTTNFTTHFTFQLITTGGYNQSGSGLAFFISTSDKAPENSTAAGLGLVLFQNDTSQPVVKPEYPFFAVEFDTRISPAYHDPSGSHIGIDINSLVSSNITDTSGGLHPELFLYNNYTFATWVEYDAFTNMIEVFMTNISSPSSTITRPLYPCLQYSYPLHTLFDNKPVYIGFTSTNRPGHVGMEGAAVFSWKFISTEGSISSKNVFTIAIPVTLFFLAVALFLAFFLYRKYKSNHKHPKLPVASSPNPPSSRLRNLIKQKTSPIVNIIPPRYTYPDLKKATNGFSEKNTIGSGGFSTVYFGKLQDGSSVAIKKIREALKREAEFASEIEIISKLRHRNLLQLQGWCYEKGEGLLVYNYMSNGSLDRHLFGKNRGSLRSETRLGILERIAAALEYLHMGLGECILHRDVKAANILLTEDFEPLLCDFGLARLIKGDQSVLLTAVGTPGYVAPEVIYMGKGTQKADVYSFGVLTLEVACGRPVIDPSLAPEEMRLLDWIWDTYKNGMLMEALDPLMVLADQDEQKRWSCVLHLGIACCHPTPESRPTMRQVIQILNENVLTPLPLSKPDAYPTIPDWPTYSIV